TALGMQAPIEATNAQVVNPTDAGYSLNVNAQAIEPIALPNREPFQLRYGPRPDGTPGRDTFDLMEVLGLQRYQYVLCLRIMRHIGYSCGIDESDAITYQDDHNLYRSYIKFLETFPEFKGFHDRFWAPRAIMYVALKSSSESWRRNNPELAATRAAAHATAKQASKAAIHVKKANRPQGQPKGKGKVVSKAQDNGTATTPATGNGDDEVNRITQDPGNTSMEPEIAEGLANMSLDLRGEDQDDDFITSGRRFFDSETPVSVVSSRHEVSPSPFNATSTPQPPGCSVTRGKSRMPVDNSVGKLVPNQSHHEPSQVFNPKNTPFPTGTMHDGVHEYPPSPHEFGGAGSSSSNHPPHPPSIPPRSGPLPIPHSLHPSSSFNSSSMSTLHQLQPLSVPVGSHEPTHNPIQNTSLAPAPTHSKSQLPMPAHDDTCACDTAPSAVSRPSTTEETGVIIPLYNCGAPSTGVKDTNLARSTPPVPPWPHAPAGIVALSTNSSTNLATIGHTHTKAVPQSTVSQPVQQVQTHLTANQQGEPVMLGGDRDLSDVPSALESNRPVESDSETRARVATQVEDLVGRATRGRKKAQPVTYNEDHDPNTDTYQGKARGRGGRGTCSGCGGHGGHVRGHGGGQVGTDDAGNGMEVEVEVEVEYMEGIR
ncbi:hypothetical protein FRC11_015052, partial [Ceratobasidium sp. 423]